jgi:predicted ATPase/DNA-binding winged helix-turn-helix (wHTH) protein
MRRRKPDNGTIPRVPNAFPDPVATPTRTIEIRVDQRRVLIDGSAAELGARAFDLLQALIERRDRVVSKNELLDIVWPAAIVEENNLQVQVSALRKILGADAIATVPGRGYRFTLQRASISGGRAESPPAVAGAPAAPAARTPGNVPLLMEPPIGRDAEIAELRALIAEHRLVSIIGAGGIGKTKVGLAIADVLRTAYADGVWWVELATLTDPELVADTVARALGVQLAANRAKAEALVGAIGDMTALLVLDNCEHLADAVTMLVDAVLARVPTLRVVVTSQEPLRTSYEHVFRLQPLATPPAAESMTASQAADFAAVRLFCERAAAVDRRFALSSSNVDAVSEICRRLDGIPLAIELAAARVSLMGAEGLRQRLGERFRVLTAGARSVLRRHQTLRATLEWSHGLLSADEQAVFRRFGVFSGGSSLGLAQAVVTDGTLDDWSALSALGTLVDKSLVVADGGDEPRYRLLETTRAYALEQLAAAGETAQWTRRHACAVLAMLTDRTASAWFSDRLPELAAELDNVRAALDWSLGESGDPAIAVELGARAAHVWRATVNMAEGLGRAARAVRHLGPDTAPSSAARLWLAYAASGLFSSNPDCFDAAQRAADLYRDLGETACLYEALAMRAGIAARRQDYPQAHAALAEARRIEDPAWAPHRRSLLAFAEWILALREGRYADARIHAQRQADLSRESGNAFGVQMGLGNVGACDAYGGAPERAIGRLREVIAELDRIGAGDAAGHFLSNLAYALMKVGETDESLAALRRAYALLRREGDQAILLSVLAQLAAMRGDTRAALRVRGYTAALWDAQRLPPPSWLSADDLAPEVASHEREALLAEGRRLPEEQVFGLVLGGSTARAA